MTTSESTQEIVKALVNATKEFEPIKKDQVNPVYGSKYAPLENLVQATRAALTKHGLIVQQEIIHGNEEKKTISVVTTIRHESGQWIKSEAFELPALRYAKGGAMVYDTQGIVLNSTYGRRVQYQSMLNLVGEEDTDAEVLTENKPGRPRKNGSESEQPVTPSFKERIREYVREILPAAGIEKPSSVLKAYVERAFSVEAKEMDAAQQSMLLVQLDAARTEGKDALVKLLSEPQ